MTTIFNYFQEFKDIYTNNSSFTKGILIDNIDKEINLMSELNSSRDDQSVANNYLLTRGTTP